MIDGMPVYLDNSATTRPFDEVASAMCESMLGSFYNPSAAYKEAVAVEKKIVAARAAIASRLSCADGDIVFTSGGTEANNLALLGTVSRFKPGRKILISDIEHPSVREIADILIKSHEVEFVPVDENGIIDVDKLKPLLTRDVSLVSIMQVNNETGALQPIMEIGALIKDNCPEALFHVDGVQGFLRCDISLRQARVDLYSISGHKIHGPKGIGALYVRKGAKLNPIIHGGGQEGNLRSGTENMPGIIGLHKAVEIFTANPEWSTEMRRLKEWLCERILSGLPSAVINGPKYNDIAATSPHIINVSFPGLRGEVLLHALEAEGVLVSTGAACSSHKKTRSRTLKAMGLADSLMESAIRISLSPTTTNADAETAIEKLICCVNRYSSFKRR